jgi:cardiolipin synthase
MLEVISKAQKSIYLQMYVFQDDMNKYNFFDTLKNRAKEGIKIKLILDSFGSIDLSNGDITILRENGIEVLFISNLMHRAHNKVLIVDELIAFTGGVNLHQSARLWNDLVVKIQGSLVSSIIRSFAKSYIDAGGKDLSIINHIKKKRVITWTTITSWIIDHSPVKNIYNLKRLYKKHIDSAQNHIILVTPYFMPKHWLQVSIHQALLRGVSIEILVPRKTDHFIIDRVNYFYINKLTLLGVKFYLESKMNHAKVMIIDADEGFIGSNNLDFLSFDLNSETGIFFKDKEVVTKLKEITENWKKDSVLFNNTTYRPKLSDYILSGLIRLFSKNI